MRFRPALLPSILVAAIIATHPEAADFGFLPWEFREISRSPRKIDSYSLPIGPFKNGTSESASKEGNVSRIVLQADGVPSTLELINSIWSGFENDGFELLYKCDTEACGGFDFRLGFDVAKPPDMYVDLGDFRFLSASRQIGETEEFLAILVSLSGERGFVQLDNIGDFSSLVDSAAFDEGSHVSKSSLSSLAEKLLANDRAVLEGLEFKTGSAELGEGTFAVLEELANFLGEYPTINIFLVGHTDNSGSMDANVKISKMRAASVMDKLVDQFGVDRSRLIAEGIGFLMPLTANSTEEGRNLNRRVEVVISSR